MIGGMEEKMKNRLYLSTVYENVHLFMHEKENVGGIYV
jgi:hypothetical protein